MQWSFSFIQWTAKKQVKPNRILISYSNAKQIERCYIIERTLYVLILIYLILPSLCYTIYNCTISLSLIFHFIFDIFFVFFICPKKMIQFFCSPHCESCGHLLWTVTRFDWGNKRMLTLVDKSLFEDTKTRL